MNSSFFIAFCIVLWLIVLASIAPTSGANTCDVLREAIKNYGEAAVVEWAKQRGYTPAQIVHVRRVCRV